MGDTTPLKLIAILSNILGNTAGQLSGVLFEKDKDKFVHEAFYISNPSVYAFVQTWSNTSCGWGGVAGQAFTDAWTVILEYTNLGIAAVWISGKLAYILELDEISARFISNESMPGWSDFKSESKRFADLKVLWIATK